jgi:mitochondrial fission protein ELM1
MDTLPIFQPDIWILLTHAPGDNDQCLALAEALDRPAAIKRLDWPLNTPAEDRAMVRHLLADTDEGRQRRREIGLHAPWPRLVICNGRRSDKVGFWIKRQSGGRTKVVVIGRARQPVASYDLLVAPPQFFMPERANVISLPLPLARRRAANDDHTPDGAGRSNIVPVPKPWFTILLGGETKQFAASEDVLADVARRAQMAADRHGGSVVISTSRRTPPSTLAAVEAVLDQPYVYRWSGASTDENPYEILLHQSAALFVTADSASMILDGAGSGTPTYVIEFPEQLDLRRRLRRSLFGYIRGAFEGLHKWGLRRVGDRLDRAQEWLHAHGMLRYPRDLRRIHTSVYKLGLARPAIFFDPSMLPARKVANDLAEISGIREVAARCRALYDWSLRRSAE